MSGSESVTVPELKVDTIHLTALEDRTCEYQLAEEWRVSLSGSLDNEAFAVNAKGWDATTAIVYAIGNINSDLNTLVLHWDACWKGTSQKREKEAGDWTVGLQWGALRRGKSASSHPKVVVESIGQSACLVQATLNALLKFGEDYLERMKKSE